MSPRLGPQQLAFLRTIGYHMTKDRYGSWSFGPWWRHLRIQDSLLRRGLIRPHQSQAYSDRQVWELTEAGQALVDALKTPEVVIPGP